MIDNFNSEEWFSLEDLQTILKNNDTGSNTTTIWRHFLKESIEDVHWTWANSGTNGRKKFIKKSYTRERFKTIYGRDLIESEIKPALQNNQINLENELQLIKLQLAEFQDYKQIVLAFLESQKASNDNFNEANHNIKTMLEWLQRNYQNSQTNIIQPYSEPIQVNIDQNGFTRFMNWIKNILHI